jgi:GTP cyclohydrolase I
MHLKKLHVTREDAEEAIRTILLWIGEDPMREGLRDTPKRVIKSYAEKFNGYNIDPKAILSTEFSETENYNGIVLLSNIDVESYCEHHLAPIIGKAHIGYIPKDKVVGISKLARLVEVFSHRLQLQERLTSQIANTINDCLEPLGIAVMIKAKHHCICHRGVNHRDTYMTTSSFLGSFNANPHLIRQFIDGTSI